jgi:riboflavin synthase
MFTGIVQEIGKIGNIESISGGMRVKINSSKILDDISVQDSISINGVCLTAVKVDKDGFWVDAVGATLDKTTFANLKLFSTVNLELALKINDRLGGHFVQGHVNGIGTIEEITELGENYWLKVVVPSSLEKYLIEEGSVSIDGISLTVAQLEGKTIGVSIIPHTWNNTNIKEKEVKDKVNIETDVLAKYIEKFITKDDLLKKTKLTENWLKELGY